MLSIFIGSRYSSVSNLKSDLLPLIRSDRQVLISVIKHQVTNEEGEGWYILRCLRLTASLQIKFVDTLFIVIFQLYSLWWLSNLYLFFFIFSETELISAIQNIQNQISIFLTLGREVRSQVNSTLDKVHKISRNTNI